MKRIIFILISLAFWLLIKAQIPKSPTTLPSPNAASLGLYGEIPVSLYTGTPSIDIPIFEVNQKKIKFPISLSYHASGVRPEQHPGWTGLGWSLNAGGAITRIVNDMPDESNNPNYYLSGNSGYYYNYSVLNTDSWNNRSYLRQIAQSMESSILKDTEPDEFQFNFLGYHGKFVMSSAGNWTVQCDKSFRIVFNNQFLAIPFDKTGTRAQTYGYSPSFKGFTIIGDDGIQYEFGGNTSSIEYSINFFEQYINEWIATTWNLTKIILPNNDEISLTYERGNFINQMYISVYNDLGSYTESSGGIFNPQPECSSWSYSSIDASYQGKLISPTYLKEISTPNSVISFDRSITNELKYSNNTYAWNFSQWNFSNKEYEFLPLLKSGEIGYPNCLDSLKWHKLDKISIKTKNNDLLKTINFSYNNISSQRLVLESVSEQGLSQEKKTYEFEYNNLNLLPPYLSNKTDHWGFYNNTYADINYANYYNYREPNSTVLLYGNLSKIKYPTGGYTRFVFEPHEYRKQLSLNRTDSYSELTSNKLAGGLRIKQIINSSTGNSSDEIIAKEYFYVSDYLQNKSNSIKSSGVLGGQIQYYFSDYIVYAFNDNNVKRKMSVFSSQSVLPGSNNSGGSHIGYTEVIEKRNDNAFTRYLFTNFDNGHMDESSDAIIQLSRTPYEPYASKEQERGLPIVQEEYDINGTKVAKKIINYVKSNENYVRAMKAGYKNVCPNTAVSYDEGSAYKIFTYSMLIGNRKEIIYNNMDSLVKEITFKYDSNRPVVVNQIEKDSRGDSITTVYTYPFHIAGGYLANAPIQNSTSGSRVISTALYATCMSMNSANIHTFPVEITTLKNTKIINSKLIYYGKHVNDYLPDLIYSLNTKTPLSTFMRFGTQGYFQNIIDGRYDTIPTTSFIYDSKSNITQVTDKNGLIRSYIWSYNYQYPVAEIKNATYIQVSNAIPGFINYITSSVNPSDATLNSMSNSLRSGLPNAFVTTYKYKPLVGITSATDPRGVTTYYDYDNFNRLKETYISENGVKKILKKYDYHYQNQ